MPSSQPWRLGWAGACLLVSLCFASPAAADTLDDIKARGALIWGADQEGGGPYIYPRPDNPDVITGFEVDLAARLAEYLKVKPQFAQGSWDGLPLVLDSKKIDLVMNGYEFEADRLESMDATIPYYIYALQLLVKKGNSQIKSWDDLRKPKPGGGKWKLSVLTESAADNLAQTFGDNVEIARFDGNTNSMDEVVIGRADATIQDTPIAVFYQPQFPDLAFIDEPLAPGYYVIYVRKGDTKLLAALNEALIQMIRNGDLERIYRKYGIWDKQQEGLQALAESAKFYGFNRVVELTKVAPNTESTSNPSSGPSSQASQSQPSKLISQETLQAPTKKGFFQVAWLYGYGLLRASLLTIALSLTSFPLAILLGLLIAIGRLYGPIWIRIPLTAYVEFLRGTPVILQLYFIYFFLPKVTGISLDAFSAGLLGLALNYAAYESEIYRAGLQAIPTGQMEAALALGMSRGMALRRIIVPQAVRIVIPPVVNDFIALFKDTSVCSAISLVELAKQYYISSQSDTSSSVYLMVLTGLLYLLMSYPMSIVASRLEKRLAREQQPG
jgi:polar amino acid transport system substrate-binding protein